MLATFMIALREGLEALLIVAITASYLRQTSRMALMPAVRWAVVSAVVLSAALGYVLMRLGGMSPLWEGWLAVLAAVMVIWCTVHMLQHGQRIKSEITGGIDSAADNGPRAAALLFVFILLMVGREGVETAAMLSSLAVNARAVDLVLAGSAGVAVAALIAGAWLRFGRRVNLGLFFRVTAVFMVLFCVQLLVYAFHEFTEVNAIPGLNNPWWHMVTEEYGPEGAYGRYFSYSLALMPLAFLVYSVWKEKSSSNAAAG